MLKQVFIPKRHLEIIRGRDAVVGAYVALWKEPVLDQMYFDRKTIFFPTDSPPKMSLPVTWHITSTAGMFFDVVVGYTESFVHNEHGLYATIQLGSKYAKDSLVESLLKFIDTSGKPIIALIGTDKPTSCKVNADHSILEYPAKGIYLYTADQLEKEQVSG